MYIMYMYNNNNKTLSWQSCTADAFPDATLKGICVSGLNQTSDLPLVE